MYLQSIYRRDDVRADGGFPWTVPVVAALERIEFTAPVAFLVGENGSGKSTLLEGMAAGLGAVAMGSHAIKDDPSLEAARAFARGFRFVRRRSPRTKMFVRAEDVFGFTKYIARLARELREEGAGGHAAMLEDRYGKNPDGRSHGETFLHLLDSRLAPNGLYFLDEPETPLSPTRVLALIALLRERVERGCQFVIATHSPILLAYPGAQILLIEDDAVRSATWDELEHVRVTRAVLNNPEGMLARL
jgi:predicted ATPase